MRATIRVYLSKPLVLRLSRNDLPLKCRGRFHHSFALLFYVNRSIAARKPAEVLLCRLQIPAHGLKALLKKDSLPTGRRGTEVCNQAIKLLDIRLSHCSCASGIVVADCDGYDLALAIHRNACVLRQVSSSIGN